MIDQNFTLVLWASVFVFLLFAFVAASSVLAAAALPGGLGYAIYWHQVKSPKALERQARDRTWKLYRAVRSKFLGVDLPVFIGDRIGFPEESDHNSQVQFVIAWRMVVFEGLDNYPPEPPTLCNTVEGGRYRDFLNQVSPDDYHERLEQICRVATLCNHPAEHDHVGDVAFAAVQEFVDGRPILPNMRSRLDDNFVDQNAISPRDYNGDDIVDAYFKGTPLALMGEMVFDDSITIPHDIRNQHHAIIAGTGHGKTQCLQQMLLEDFEEEDACVIVIDSQGSMLEKLLHVVPEERCMYLDGGNIRQPLALSAFEIGRTDRPEDEPKVRTAVALYEHMFAARDTALTTIQSTLYRFLSRFLMVIPNATFNTALEILQYGYEAYTEHVEKLDETSQTFVTTQLCNPKDKHASQSYRTTRQEVARRLFTLMESRTLKGMFNAPESRVDIGAAIRDEKIILINTAQAVLGDEGAQLLGKYCFAKIAIEVLARAETHKRVYLYLDEAQEYLSDSPIIRRLYEQGRKRGLCMITACQEVNQLERAGIDKMIYSLTSIKFAGGVSAQDATRLAKEMDSEGDILRGVPALTFAAWIKHHGTGQYQVTPGLLEDQIAASDVDTAELKSLMVGRYHYSPDRAEATDEDSSADSGTADFEGYWGDDGLENPPDESPKKKPEDRDDAIDPDEPQDLD